MVINDTTMQKNLRFWMMQHLLTDINNAILLIDIVAKEFNFNKKV